MATTLVPVTPSVLRWARQSVDVSPEEAAARAGVAVERLLSWEDGSAEPTLAKLRALAAMYQRPLSVFLLPEPPRDFATPRDFRRLPEQMDHTWSRALHKVYRRALDQQSAAVELLEEAGEPAEASLPSLSVSIDPEVAGQRVREALGIELEEQFAWRTPEKAFTGWLQAVEGQGVYVLRTSEVELTEMRGFSVPGQVAVIVVNALDRPRGQVFTLLHELAHLTLREGGLCDLQEPQSPAGRRTETWCNAVAAATLMPRASFLEQIDPEGEADEQDWGDAVLSQLSQRWGVSEEAIARRLVTLEQVPASFYQAKREEYLARYARDREEEKARRAKRTGAAPPHRMAIRDQGKPYVRLVLDAYHRETLSMASVSTLLNLKVRHLERLEHEIGA